MTRTVRDVLTCLNNAGLLSAVSLGALSYDAPLFDITFDNRTAKKGSVFVCKGKAFKEEYLFGAFENGAILYIADHTVTESLPYLLVRDIRLAMSKLGAVFFEEDCRDVVKIGITGTKGKTTVSILLKSILDSYCVEQYSKECALLSSLYIYDGKDRVSSELTTPEAIEFFRHLKNAGDCRLPFAVCEVSSQGLKYHRVSDVCFDAALFLNIGNDHISEVEHPDFEDYFSSKLKIFDRARTACINAESSMGKKAVAYAQRMCQAVYTFGFSCKDTLYCRSHWRKDDCEILSVSFHGGAFENYALRMFGKHNVENALAAILIAKLYGVPEAHIRQGLLSAEIEGRGQEYVTDDGEVRVIVDYAHNGMSLEALYRYVKEAYSDAFVVTVFGCPGGKAKNRRKDMGEMAALYSDFVILTEDDPAGESIADICNEIASYLEEKNTPYICEYDRGQAVELAFEKRQGKTVILLCGKGAEKTQKRLYGKEYYAGDAELAQGQIDVYNRRVLPIGS